jgi:hypothetical protein
MKQRKNKTVSFRLTEEDRMILQKISILKEISISKTIAMIIKKEAKEYGLIESRG